MSTVKPLIVYSSPAGTTRHLSRVIAKKLADLGYAAGMYDLGSRDECSMLAEAVKRGLKNCCLWIGTPVYAAHAVPPIEGFIAGLPLGRGNFAVPFVTWGGVTSGVALDEMAMMLTEKGYVVLGAAKVIAAHSMMWKSNNPLGGGHPDARDDVMVAGLVEGVHSKLGSEPVQPLPLEVLNYQTQKVREFVGQLNIEAAKKILPPLDLDEGTCTRCGVCANECPAFAITLNPYPHFGDECFICYNCLRHCEEGAITADLSPIETMLKGKAADQPEFPPSQIFI